MPPGTHFLFTAGRAFRVVSSAFISSAGATLTLSELRANIRQRWQTFNGNERDVESGLADWETAITDQLARPGASVLVVGCGSGRDLLPYLQRGCRVTGVDPAPDALALAAQVVAKHGFTANLIEGFIEDVAVSGEFDAISFSWGCYESIPESARRVRTLARMASHLKPGGLIGLNHQPLPRPRGIITRFARAAGAVARSDWRMESGDIIEWRRLDSGAVFDYTHAFNAAEVERESAAAGLRVVCRQDPPAFPFYILARRAG
jgi:SAM-dependent methyltransferase